jgi:hypothetical protein
MDCADRAVTSTLGRASGLGEAGHRGTTEVEMFDADERASPGAGVIASGVRRSLDVVVADAAPS